MGNTPLFKTQLEEALIPELKSSLYYAIWTAAFLTVDAVTPGQAIPIDWWLYSFQPAKDLPHGTAVAQIYLDTGNAKLYQVLPYR